MTDAVFDTVIYLQATLSDKGAAYACWQLVEKAKCASLSLKRFWRKSKMY